MPFDVSIAKLTGNALSVLPEYGYGWVIVHAKGEAEDIETPPPFEAELEGVLMDGSETRAAVGKLAVEFQGQVFAWASFIPRTDDFIDLSTRSVTCNILIANTRPYIAEQYPFPDPSHVSTEGYPQVRGFGKLSLRQNGLRQTPS